MREVQLCCLAAGAEFSGENALFFTDWNGYAQILHKAATSPIQWHGLTFLRLCDQLLEPQNLRLFVEFSRRFSSASGDLTPPPVDPQGCTLARERPPPSARSALLRGCAVVAIFGALAVAAAVRARVR